MRASRPYKSRSVSSVKFRIYTQFIFACSTFDLMLLDLLNVLLDYQLILSMVLGGCCACVVRSLCPWLI
jgi:hypothetical protein